MMDSALHPTLAFWGPGLALVLFLVFFVAIMIWVYRPGSRNVYQESARLPLEQDAPASRSASNQRPAHGDQAR